MQLRDLIPFRLRLALRYGPASSLGARLRFARCRLCNKLLLHQFPRPRSDARGLGVVVYEPRMQLFGEDKVVIAFLESGGATDMYTDTAIVLCRGCWKNKLRPALTAEIDKDVAAIADGEGSKASDRNLFGDLAGEYYVSRLAQFLEPSGNRDVIGWTLYITAHNVQYSKKLKNLESSLLLPKIRPLMTHADPDIARAASLVVKQAEGGSIYHDWSQDMFGGKRTWCKFSAPNVRS